MPTREENELSIRMTNDALAIRNYHSRFSGAIRRSNTLEET
ncbi:hypothetical protein ECAE60S_02931 [Eoetvoesiella caeni]